MTEKFTTRNDDLGESQDVGGVKVAVAQFGPGPNVADNLGNIEALVQAAAENGARLIVLPEYSQVLGGELGQWVFDYAESLEGQFVDEIAQLADSCDIAIVVGMLEKSDNASDPRPFNTAIAVLPGAGVVARYRKVHLFDAFNVTESNWMQPGDPSEEPQTFEVDGVRVGMQTCYDLRFPETTRRVVDSGVHLIALIAEWLSGPKKAHHWAALTSARAIENTVYVAAADQIPPIAVGMSRVISPIGETLIDMAGQMGVSIATVNVKNVEEARATNPSLTLRRYDVVPKTT